MRVSAMADAYEQSRGDLAARMLAALEAAEAEGGDIRGRQSAALVVVNAQSSVAWQDRVFDLRKSDIRVSGATAHENDSKLVR